MYRSNLRAFAHPLSLAAGPNGLDRPRLGLSIGKRVGNAVARNRVKRRIREAFRLLKPTLPAGLDLVVGARPHAPMPTERYAELLEDMARGLGRQHAKREARRHATEPGKPGPDKPKHGKPERGRGS